MTDTSSPRPTRDYHHGDLRASLVEAATILLEEEGIAALSLRRVARRAGVSHAAPYRHFKDKHELLEAVAAHGFQVMEARLDEVVLRHGEDPRRQVIEASRAYITEALARPHRGHLMFGGYLDPSRQSEELRRAGESAFQKLVSVVRRGEGTLYRDLPTRELVLTLWSATHGLAMLAAADQLEPLEIRSDPRQLTESLIENLLTGLERR